MSSLEKCLFTSSAIFDLAICVFFFFFFILSCMSRLSILEINPLLSLHLQIFSPIWRAVFISFMVTFVFQIFLNLIRSHLLSFYFHYSTWWIEKILLQFMSMNALPMFSSKSFIVSGFTLRILIHLEFLYTVLENVLLSFFCMQLSSLPSTTYYRQS